MDYDLAVVGGGIAGLTLANDAARAGWRTVLIEGRERLGGAIYSARSDDEFWLELGAHTLFNSYGTVLDLLARSDAPAPLARRRLGYRLGDAQGLHGLASRIHVLELARHAPTMLGRDKEGRTVRDWFGGLVGPRNWIEVIGPALDAVICQPAADFPADLLFPARPRRRGVPRSFTLPGGMSTLIERLSVAEGLALQTGAVVQTIDYVRSRYQLRTADGTIQADRLALATPVGEAARLLESVEPEVAQRLSLLEEATVESVGVVVKADDLDLPALAGVIGIGEPYWSAVSRDVLPHPRWRGFTFHQHPQGLDEDARLALVGRVLGVHPSSFRQVWRTTHRLPSLRLGHTERMARLDGLLIGKPLALTGNYFSGLSVESCAARSRAEFRRLAGFT